MSRIRANALKQAWKYFICWLIDKYGYTGLMLDKVEITSITYLESRRKADVDGTTPKFILDGFTESGFLTADDYTCLQSLTLKMGYDKDNPRTEFLVKTIEA